MQAGEHVQITVAITDKSGKENVYIVRGTFLGEGRAGIAVISDGTRRIIPLGHKEVQTLSNDQPPV